MNSYFGRDKRCIIPAMITTRMPLIMILAETNVSQTRLIAIRMRLQQYVKKTAFRYEHQSQALSQFRKSLATPVLLSDTNQSY
eukprot:3917586-Amphidinium_carterae.1